MGLLSKTAGFLDHRFGWDRLPRPLGVLTLVGLRQTLRKRNLYDTGVSDAVAPADVDAERPHARRQPHRPGPADDGDDRPALRPQRAGRDHRARAPAGHPRAEPAAREPRAADARRVHPGDDRERPRRRVAPVRGPRLVQPRPERGGEPLGGRARGRRPLVRAPDADRADAPRPEPPRRRDPADVRDRGLALVGRIADLRQRRGLRAGSARDEGGKLRLDPDGQLPRDLDDKRRPRRASPATSGSASRSCTRCSRTSTTRSATGSPRRTRAGRTTSSTRRRAWSTRR